MYTLMAESVALKSNQTAGATGICQNCSDVSTVCWMKSAERWSCCDDL